MLWTPLIQGKVSISIISFTHYLDVIKLGNTIGALLDKYLISEAPKKALTTQQGNRIQIKALRKVFGDMPLLPFQPKFVYKYVEMRVHEGESFLTECVDS